MATSEDDIKDLMNRTQGPDEEASVFLVKFQLLAKDIEMYTRYTEAEIARLACKNLRPEYQSQIRREHIRGFAQLQEECRSISQRNKSIQNLRPPPKPESSARSHLAYRSNKNFTKRQHADAIENVEEEEDDVEDVAALYNNNRSNNSKPRQEVDRIKILEAELEKMKQALQNKDSRQCKLESSENKKVDNETKESVCYKCKLPGHFVKECPEPGIRCYGCNTPNVTKPKCPKCNPGNEQ